MGKALTLIAKGQTNPRDFMQGIKNMMSELVSRYREFDNSRENPFTDKGIAFDGKPFNYLETEEKTEEKNFNQLDGQINNIDNEKDDIMENTIIVLVIEPMKEPYVKYIEPGLKSLQAEVGGNIEAYYPFDNKVGIICNENGKINGLPLNRAIYDDDKNMIKIIAGTFLICGLDNENGTFASLDKNMIKNIRICLSTLNSF